ncbi:hypothetical protein A2300_00730 [Candidatus Falkowbacteria bacterium RIFOXYB2_FULL_35_7]|nr:MAG: hypothetical protein A2300_00730 [Candidatus Falkowbacteria bacterium RIFOXYB2_FULL_35_7]
MEKIESKENPKIKILKKLSKKKFRSNYNKFKVESLKVVVDGFRGGVFPEELYLAEKIVEKWQKEISFLDSDEKKLLDKIEIYLLNDDLYEKISDLETPEGICAVYTPLSSSLKFDQSIIYLNGIADPGNLGTILRTALAFSFHYIVLDQSCVDLYNPKTISAAREAIFKLKIVMGDNKTFDEIKKKMLIVVSSLGGTEDLVCLKKSPICLVLGSESKGIEQGIVDKADFKVKIKISEDIESLNVSTAGAILFYLMSN